MASLNSKGRGSSPISTLIPRAISGIESEEMSSNLLVSRAKELSLQFLGSETQGNPFQISQTAELM